MEKNILNFVIAVALFAIVVAISRDIFFKDKIVALPTVTEQPTLLLATPTPIPASKFISCSNDFFTFKKGATWKYQFIIFQPTLTTKLFSNEITATDSSSITLTTTIQGDKNSTTIHLSCESDGIHGVPFSLLEDSLIQGISGIKSVTNLVKIDPDFVLIPNKDIIESQKSFISHITGKTTIPFLTQTFSADIISSPSGNFVKNATSYTFDSYVDLKNFAFLLGKDIKDKKKIATYTIKRGEGITNMNIYLDFKKDGLQTAQIKLLDFTP